MKYSGFKEGDKVLVYMPQGSGFEHPQEAIVIEKGAYGVCLFEKPNGRRWWANSSRIKEVKFRKLLATPKKPEKE